MKKIRLEIAGLSFSQTQSGAYALVLGEQGGNRRLPIIIGGFEAQAIAVELESMTPTRPLTHDLFKTFAETFDVQVNEVLIYNLVEGIFYAKLICNDGTKDVEIDARTSDAIALAVRFACPIYTYEFILKSLRCVQWHLLFLPSNYIASNRLPIRGLHFLIRQAHWPFNRKIILRCRHWELELGRM